MRSEKYFITITNWFQNHALCILKLGLPMKPGCTNTAAAMQGSMNTGIMGSRRAERNN